MSMSPEPRYWPQEMKKVSSGIPKHNDNKRNCTTNAAKKRGTLTLLVVASRVVSKGGGMLLSMEKKRISSHQ